jgi:hypothetical protein
LAPKVIIVGVGGNPNVIAPPANGANYFVDGGGSGVVLEGGVAGGVAGGEIGNIWIKPPPEPVEVPGNTGIFTHTLVVVIIVPTGQLPSGFFRCVLSIQY